MEKLMEKLKETAKAYTEKYPERLKQFLNENEADKSDYIKRESEYFENTLWDLENRDEILYHIDALLINNSPNGFSLTGIENLNMACDLGNQIGFDKLMDSIKKKVKFLESEKPSPPQQKEKIKKTETPKNLSELITHKKNIEIVESIKIQYKNIKGRRLKLLLLAFQDLQLIPKARIAQKFYDCCKKEFSWNIASYNAMNGYNFNSKTDNEEFTIMKQSIETLIKQIKPLA